VYCNFKEEQVQSVTNLLASLCAQSMYIQPSISERAKARYMSNLDTKQRPDLQFIQDLLQTEIRRYGRVYIVVDALDECSDKNNERNVLLNELRKLLLLLTNVQLLFTSRPSISILSHFPDCKTLAVSARDEDVKQYVRSKLPHLHDFVQRDPILQEEIIDGIARTVNGM
jgi:hypothetical protein